MVETAHVSTADRILGCLFGGACGDALGAPVEFMSLDAIQRRYGEDGITRFDEAYGVDGAITDDTQMTLFTAEGLIRAVVRMHSKGICHPPSVVHNAYRRWLATQDENFDVPHSSDLDGWLIAERRLWERRAPGSTCLSALRASSDNFGEPAVNNSKGCGTVMRDAVWGLVYSGERRVFDDAAAAARTTHGHPSAAYSSGAVAAIIRQTMDGRPLRSSIEAIVAQDLASEDAQEVRNALQRALDLSSVSDWSARLPELGEGWVAEEALAIAVLCALAAETPRDAVIAAVNHSGDSDSTGAICGNLVGAMQGVAALPHEWTSQVEMRDVIERIAADLTAVVEGRFDKWDEYPGW